MLSELHDLNERWSRAWRERDAATVERLTAEDYLYVAPNGLTLDRQAILAIIRSPTYRLDRATRTRVVIRALGREAAVVRYCSQAAGSFQGAPFTDDHGGVMVCEKQDGEWRIVMEQHSLSGT
jgi:ketosteroid isomerase-like protein